MKNKEEILFNCKGLVSTWLDKVKDIHSLRLIFTHSTSSTTIPCYTYDCANKLADVLYDNKDGYTYVILRGIEGRVDKVLGELEID